MSDCKIANNNLTRAGTINSRKKLQEIIWLYPTPNAHVFAYSLIKRIRMNCYTSTWRALLKRQQSLFDIKYVFPLKQEYKLMNKSLYSLFKT